MPSYSQTAYALLWLTKQGIRAFPQETDLFVTIQGHDLQLSDREIAIKAELWTEYKLTQQNTHGS